MSATTPQQFLEEYPLYRHWKTTDWSRPETISLDCWNCKKETTWSYDDDYSRHGRIRLYAYTCHHCKRAHIFYGVWSGQDAVFKVGQFPKQLVRVPNSIEKRLGASAEFYRKALTSRNEGYGIAAVAYLRRVVEDQTSELIEVVAAAAEAYGVEATNVAKIRAAKEQKVYEDKLKIAAQAMPSVLKPDGANPLQALHDMLSRGLHNEPEEECLQIADEMRDIFDYLFDRLRTEVEERTSFVTKVKAIVGKRGPPRTAAKTETAEPNEKPSA